MSLPQSWTSYSEPKAFNLARDWHTFPLKCVADSSGGVSNGVRSFVYSVGTLMVHNGGAGTPANPADFGVITGLALHV